MPKEVVYGEAFEVETTGERHVPVAVVRWSRESGDVQLVTRDHEAEVPSAEEWDNIPARYGFYVSLDRRGINDLIRNLRRARDQAFGRDE